MREQIKLFCTYLCRQDELYAVIAKKIGVSFHTLMVLYALDQDEGSTQSQISKTWLIPKQTLNTVIKDLQSKEYVKLETGRNQKEKLVYFTSLGKKFAKETLLDVYDLEDKAIEKIGKERFLQMVQINKDFTDALAEEVYNDT